MDKKSIRNILFTKYYKKTIISLLLLCSITYILYHFAIINLLAVSYYSGFVLLACIIFLTLFNSRKKLPFFPVLKASTWMKWHSYIGYFTLFLFFVHIRFAFNGGTLELLLALFFLIVSVSGIIGLFISKFLPYLMTASGETLIYEKIPKHKIKIQNNIKNLVLDSENKLKSSTLTDFYNKYLHVYIFKKPFIFYPFSRKKDYFNIKNELNNLKRYLAKDEQEYADKIGEWLETKYNLDIQYSSQKLLRYWLFIHIPMTYSMLVLVAIHVYYAIKYGGFG